MDTTYNNYSYLELGSFFIISNGSTRVTSGANGSIWRQIYVWPFIYFLSYCTYCIEVWRSQRGTGKQAKRHFNLIPAIPRKATNNDFSLAMNINSSVAQARNSLLFRAFAPCSWCSLFTEKSAICDLPRYSSKASIPISRRKKAMICLLIFPSISFHRF